jgi:hypothetical protein
VRRSASLLDVREDVLDRRPNLAEQGQLVLLGLTRVKVSERPLGGRSQKDERGVAPRLAHSAWGTLYELPYRGDGLACLAIAIRERDGDAAVVGVGLGEEEVRLAARRQYPRSAFRQTFVDAHLFLPWA